MGNSIFITRRKGYLGQKPVGAEYMAGVEARARMLQRACRVTDDDVQPDRQLRLPLIPGSVTDKQDRGGCLG